MHLFPRDLRFAARTLAKAPAFTLAVVLTLALGIGANTAIFTVLNALLLRPFPYRSPAQLLSVSTKDEAKDFGCTLVRYELVRDFNHSFESVAVWANDNLNLTGRGEPLQVPIARVSPSFFPMLGIQPQLGRIFTQEEGTPQGKAVVILSNEMWRTRFHADQNVIGQTVNLDSIASTIVGVLPADARFPFMPKADIFTPRYFELSLIPPQRLRMGVGYLNLVARMRPEITLQRVNTELAVLNQRYRDQNPTAPDAGSANQMIALHLHDEVVGSVRRKVLVLSGAVMLVLLIACANVASMLLARAIARRKEFAMRAALGASRSVILRQVLTESLLIAFLAGTLGAAIGWAATRIFAVAGSSQLPSGIPIGVDLNVLLFTASISALAGVLFGIVPAFQLSQVDLNSTLRDAGQGVSSSYPRSRLKNLLVVGQVALSLLLLIGAGLLLRSFEQLLRVDPGFDVHSVLAMNISLSTTKYAKPDQQIAFFDDVVRRVSALPGVSSAAISAALPLSWKRITPVLPEGQPDVPLAQRPFVDIEAISPEWFKTMRVPLRGGRTFSPADDASAPPVVIVNETFARQFWPGASALDKKVIIGRRLQPATVVGVAVDVKNKGIEQETQPQLYLPFPQLPWSDMNLLVRTAVPPLQAASAVRNQIASVDGDQPVTDVKTVEELIDDSRAQPRFTMLLVSCFSGVALVLAIIGVYGVLSYMVAQRRREFGIRMALGADRAAVLRLVLRQGMILTVAGLAAGLAAALLLTRLMATMLYKVGTHDIATFALAPILFLCITSAASYLPARQATRVDPIEALK
jgi:putative ABC transport system permease protein